MSRWVLFKNLGFILMVLTLATPSFADEFDLFSSGDDEEELAPKVDTKKTFSSNLEDMAPKKAKEEPIQKQEDEEEAEEKTQNWLQSLISQGKSELFDRSYGDTFIESEEKLIENRRSNAATFDISGIKLRMSPAEIEEILTSRGFTRITQNKNIPNFIKWRGEELCRLHGVIGFDRLNFCAAKLARENNLEFIEYERYTRPSTKESLEISYTSSFTNNLSHLITYQSSVSVYDSRASKNVYLNNLKVYDWWKRIDFKYGAPDNASEIKWGKGGKKPYLKASFGKLELADPLLRNLDFSRMLVEDSKLSHTEYFNF